MHDKRDYLKNNEDSTFDFGSSIPDNVSLTDTFSEVSRRLKSDYEINKGVLLVRNTIDQTFSAISTWSNGKLRFGLTIKLPEESSLFIKVASDGNLYSENFIAKFSGNFFERKLLMDDFTQSFVLQPLKHEGEVVGMIGYSSAEPTTFAMFEEGILDDISAELAQIIVKNPNLF